MNYTDPELRDRLAAEYVLGTLHGRARRRFQTLMVRDPWLRREVHAWEQRLAPLAMTLDEERPPARVWRGIRREIRPVSTTRRWLWPLATAASAMAAVLLAVLLMLQQAADVGGSYVALLGEDPAQPRWIVQVDADARRAQISAIDPVSPAQGRAFELWVLPVEEDAPPRSLGLLPRTGERSVVVPDPVTLPRGLEQGLAVSVEPEGGSPTGLPTGEIVYRAKPVRL